MSEVALVSRKPTRTEPDGISGAASHGACVKKVFQEGRESMMIVGPSMGMCSVSRFEELVVPSSNQLSTGVAAVGREVVAQCRNLPSPQEASQGK